MMALMKLREFIAWLRRRPEPAGPLVLLEQVTPTPSSLDLETFDDEEGLGEPVFQRVTISRERAVQLFGKSLPDEITTQLTAAHAITARLLREAHPLSDKPYYFGVMYEDELK